MIIKSEKEKQRKDLYRRLKTVRTAISKAGGPGKPGAKQFEKSAEKITNEIASLDL